MLLKRWGLIETTHINVFHLVDDPMIVILLLHVKLLLTRHSV